VIHPHSELRMIDHNIGYGVFATSFIPRGTITYAKDPLEIELSQTSYELLEPTYQAIADKYSYVDEYGTRIISWDHAKYVNHSCDCNTISTGYGFEIAIKDIKEGDEITDEYGLFNMKEQMTLSCACRNCRKILTPSDVDIYYATWDRKIRRALRELRHVTQPLMPFLDKETYVALMQFINGESKYRSVYSLKYVSDVETIREPVSAVPMYSAANTVA
jgi:hypothetical protein